LPQVIEAKCVNVKVPNWFWIELWRIKKYDARTYTQQYQGKDDFAPGPIPDKFSVAYAVCNKTRQEQCTEREKTKKEEDIIRGILLAAKGS
jgi:hypothetical protein